MIFNLIHRACTSDESYYFQRQCAHELNLKATVLIPSDCLENEELLSTAKQDHEIYGDEIGIWLSPLKHHANTQVWLLSEQDKQETIKYSIDRYCEIFGCAPKAVGNYVMDAQLIKYVKEYCPEVTAVIAGCFEEGVKVYHGCNNSWYLFSEGMSWNPWYPSKTHSIRPAADEEEWAGVVAVPHLSRDLVLGYEGRNDFFASHPANIQRGLVNDGIMHHYDYNLVDQYRMQEDYNHGFSYYQIHVSPGWFHGNPNIMDDDETTRRLYRETLEYLADLKKEGKLQDMHLSEFALYYEKTIPISNTDIGIGKDILYGSGKHYFWIFNPDYRILIDTFQGGSIGDFRPYIGKYASFTGVDSDALAMNSYPYLIQSQYRSGIKNHHEDGARTTLFVKHGEEELDLCNYPSRIQETVREKDCVVLMLTPVELCFKDGLQITLQTIYRFVKGGEVEVIRKLLSVTDSNVKLEMTEHVKACYGFTEYPENMKGITLYIGDKQVADYMYRGHAMVSDAESSVTAVIPQITTAFTLASSGIKPERAEIGEGHLFSPFYTMKLHYSVSAAQKEVKSCLRVKRIKM